MSSIFMPYTYVSFHTPFSTVGIIFGIEKMDWIRLTSVSYIMFAKRAFKDYVPVAMLVRLCDK